MLAFVAAAVLTPPDPISQISLAIPIVLLYEVSIVSVRFVERRRRERDEAEEGAPGAAAATAGDGGEEAVEETDFNLGRE